MEEIYHAAIWTISRLSQRQTQEWNIIGARERILLYMTHHRRPKKIEASIYQDLDRTWRLFQWPLKTFAKLFKWPFMVSAMLAAVSAAPSWNHRSWVP